jgi:serine/threonine-protein kinase HipA
MSILTACRISSAASGHAAARAKKADIKPRILTTAIDEADGTASLDLALEVAPHFGVKADRAKAIAHDVGKAVARWRETAASTGLSSNEVERMSSAFEHEELNKAISILS